MALKIGIKAPNFTLPSTSGKNFTLDIDQIGKPLIIYFYPKDFTAGCTAEACEFRDSFSVFRDFDIEIVGISRDSILTHRAFKNSKELPFELLADEDGAVAKQYDAMVPFINLTRRITYLLDKNHSIVGAYENMFAASGHIKAMIKELKSNQIAASK